MVGNVSSFGRSGLYDWVVQRITAVILAAYTLCILGTLLFNPDMDHAQWSGVFASFRMKFFTLLALLSLVAHGWIGMWTISTDYLTPALLGKAATAVRLLFQLACLLVLFTYFVWGIQILWSV